MKAKLLLSLFVFLGLGLGLGCTPSEDHDHDHDHDVHAHDGGTHEESHNSNHSDDVDGGVASFELPLADPEIIVLAGEHSDGYYTHVITASTWHMYGDGEDVSVFKILTYSNREGYAIALNHADNAFAGGAYSRFDWFIDDANAVHYCQTRFDAATEQEAFEAAAADADDLAGAGCGGFSWSELTAVALDLVGSYTDSWGTTHEIDGDGWEQVSSWSNDGGVVTDSSKFVRLHHSNKQRWLIAQNDEDNSWNAGLFSRFDWTEVEGQTYFCQTTYDSATAKEALEAAAADAEDPANGGCGFSTWSALTE